jgi:D-alanine-D-alanine ligase
MDDIKKIGIVHNVPTSQASPFFKASMDIMIQVESIESTLNKLGYASRRIPLTRNLAAFIECFNKEHVDMVFNLCETVDEDPALAAHPAAVLELLNIPFTGSPSMTLMTTTDKVMTKRLLKGRGIRTAHYLIYDGSEHFNPSYLSFPVIVKPRYEDASVGIDQGSIFEDEKELKTGLKDMYEHFGALLIEEYIDGKEFNVSLFGYPEAQVMPVAEVDFSRFPQNLYPIVGYRAKWDENSFEYHNTPRNFSPAISQSLLWEIERIVLDCYNFFMLRDYGRIDMRVNEYGKIYVLEINANPCLSPDAGFPAALQHAGISYESMVQTFIDFMIQRSHNVNQVAHSIR